MLQTEYVRNLNTNYERILLEKKPEENRYQYCILSRGGIRGLLPCGLRYINGLAYLYYDISSKQNAAQLFGSKNITREWIRDFLWSVQQIQQELGRFLLEDRNILWYPDQIFQDLENKSFFFLYVPYYEGESGFQQLLEFWIEHIDYEDEVLVDCVYHMYENMESNGEMYLQGMIFEDAKMLEQQTVKAERRETAENAAPQMEKSALTEVEPASGEKRESKKGLRSIFEGKRRKDRELRENYRQGMQQSMNGYAVAEEFPFEEEYGRTVYMEEKPEENEQVRRLYTSEDRLLAEISKASLVLGKKRAEAEIVLEDPSVSRIHARITKEGENYYLEDLNSTNGTFKNGLRLQPYEKKKLEPGDEIKCGRVLLVFR